MPAERRLRAVAGAALLLAAEGPLAAQEADSLAALRRARAEQAAFERYRSSRLPTTFQGGGGPCTERIGRWCVWFEAPRDDPRRAEHPAVRERRGRLVHALAEHARAAPGEPWIVGQLVRYLVEGGDLEGAIAAARSCRAEPWWCLALEGFALHGGGRWAEAERVFGAALEAMPPAERRLWTDPTVLLREGDRRRLRRMGEADRAGAERRLWWLADPLWSVPGNDRWTEHLVRWTAARMLERARQVDAMPFTADLREIVLRYGVVEGWERSVRPFTSATSLVGYGTEYSWEFLAPLPMALEPATLDPAVWPLSQDAATATRYAPPYARRLLPLAVQLARFRRPGGELAVVGYALAPDSVPAGARVRATAVAATGPGGGRTAPDRIAEGLRGTLLLPLPAGTPVVSVEAVEDSARLAARWRGPLAPRGDARISDLLLLSDPEARPATLEEAVPLARGGTRAAPGERVALFWEVYDVPPGDSLTLRVTLEAPRAGWTRRRLQALGLSAPPRPVRLRVAEDSPGGEVVSRSLAVALPPDLRPGEHVLEIAVQGPVFGTATARRAISVVR